MGVAGLGHRDLNTLALTLKEEPTNLVGDSEGGVQAIILNDSAAPLWGADCAHISHAERVTRVVATQVLGGGGWTMRTMPVDFTIIRRRSRIKLCDVMEEYLPW